MNLGLITIQKGVSSEALRFFHDALRLPSGLDGQAKSRALMAIARVHYARREYREAAVYAREAVGLIDGGETNDVFTLGVYAALAGDVNECLAHLEQVIRKQAAFFARAAVEPDLDPSRSEVLSLLSRLALEAHGRVQNEVTTATKLLEGIHAHPESAAVVAEARLAANALEDISRATSRASYHGLLQLHDRAREVAKGINAISAAADSAVKKRNVERQMASLVSAATGAERDLEALGALDQLPPFRIRAWFLWHVGTWLLLAFGTLTQANGISGPLVWLGWFWVGMPVWAVAEHLSERHAWKVLDARRAERDRRSYAASSARNAATKADADRRAHNGRCQSLLAEARKLINGARAGLLAPPIS
jgi:tetratricopeptide (TPR) repeat protein